MKESENKSKSTCHEETQSSRNDLEAFYVDSLHEMYYAESAISTAFGNIKDQIISPNLLEILKIHFAIHLKHKERLEKIFKLRNEKIKTKNSESLNGILSEALHHLAVFSTDPVNWEIALILVSQKLAHYKIASYGGLAHLAINLNDRSAATFLAFSVQEEEEFLSKKLNELFDAFLASHVEGYKSETN